VRASTLLCTAHTSWHSTLHRALDGLDDEYLEILETTDSYIPSKEQILNAFSSIPKESVNYILFGQDPYPRKQSAIGYAFIDGAVESIFGDSGLSKPVNRATSLRNFVKMALVADDKLTHDNTTQTAIAQLDKSDMIDSMTELRVNFEQNGVLLLNTALIFTDKSSSASHVKQWREFIQILLEEMVEQNPTLILFGTHAKELKKLPSVEHFESISIEHPYNHTFVYNTDAHRLFGPMRLLQKPKEKPCKSNIHLP